jgi:hypothetical protein
MLDIPPGIIIYNGEFLYTNTSKLLNDISKKIINVNKNTFEDLVKNKNEIRLCKKIFLCLEVEEEYKNIVKKNNFEFFDIKENDFKKRLQDYVTRY